MQEDNEDLEAPFEESDDILIEVSLVYFLINLFLNNVFKESEEMNDATSTEDWQDLHVSVDAEDKNDGSEATPSKVTPTAPSFSDITGKFSSMRTA